MWGGTKSVLFCSFSRFLCCKPYQFLSPCPFVGLKIVIFLKLVLKFNCFPIIHKLSFKLTDTRQSNYMKDHYKIVGCQSSNWQNMLVNFIIAGQTDYRKDWQKKMYVDPTTDKKWYFEKFCYHPQWFFLKPPKIFVNSIEILSLSSWLLYQLGMFIVVKESIVFWAVEWYLS